MASGRSKNEAADCFLTEIVVRMAERRKASEHKIAMMAIDARVNAAVSACLKGGLKYEV
jgi:ribosomal protein S1